MSMSENTPSALTVRGWTTEDVVFELRQNGLDDVVPSFRNRNIDGNAFLKLTEIQLKTGWNHELGVTSIWKIVKLINDIKAQTDMASCITFGGQQTKAPIPPKPDLKPKVKPKTTQLPAEGPWKIQSRNTGSAPIVGVRPPPFCPATPPMRRDPIPLPAAAALIPPSQPSHANRRDQSPGRFKPVSPKWNSRDQTPVPPSSSGNWRSPGPTSTLGSPFPSSLPPSHSWEWKPKPPTPQNKPMLFGVSEGKNVASDCLPVEARLPEKLSLLEQQLSSALRMRAAKSAVQLNGGSPAKPVAELVQRPTFKSPVEPSQPAKRPAYLPMPPPVATGQEDEHMKEIVGSIQIPSMTPEVNEIVHNNEELYENTAAGNDEEIYEEPDMLAWEAVQAETKSKGSGEEEFNDESSGIYEYISEDRTSSDYYIQPSGTVNSSTIAEFESTHVQVEELPVAPSVPAKPQGGSFMLNLKASLFGSSSSPPQQKENKDNISKSGSESPTRGESPDSPGETFETRCIGMALNYHDNLHV